MQYIKVNEENINKYSSLLFEILELIKRNFQRSITIKNQFCNNFLEMQERLNQGMRFDFYYYFRVLEVNDTPVSLMVGIVSYHEEGAFFQIGYFGTLKRYQRKGYAKRLLQEVTNELTELGVNVIWGMMKHSEFWIKSGFTFDVDGICQGKSSSISSDDNVYLKVLNEDCIELNDFFSMFDKDE